MPERRFRLDHEGRRYRVARMCARDQFWANGVIAPVIATVRGKPGRAPAWGEALIKAASELQEDDVDRLLVITLGAAEREGATGAGAGAAPTWTPIWDAEAGEPLVPDLDGVAALRLAAAIVARNLRAFWQYEPVQFARTVQPDGYSAETMPGGLDFLLLPVRRRLLPFSALLDGSVDLADVAMLNDALALEAENAARAQAASKGG